MSSVIADKIEVRQRNQITFKYSLHMLNVHVSIFYFFRQGIALGGV